MEKLIYLDNSATTAPCNMAIEEAKSVMEQYFGNPSSLYEFGFFAEEKVSNARRAIAQKLSCREDEIFFTSCGSESNNTAIFGAAKLLRRKGKHIITTKIEHPSVLEPIAYLEKEGYEITRLTPDINGNILVTDLENALREDTVLISMMMVNNEVGSLLPVDKIRVVCNKKQVSPLIHIDAVQAFGKFPIVAGNLGADLISISAHKVHGIKGAGALYVKKGIKLPPLILGGGQEKGLRSGTEAVPAIAAFGAAVKQLPDTIKASEKIKEIKDYCITELEKFQNVVINSPKQSSPFILNFSFLGYRSETILHFLESSGICVSSGSACSKGKGSYVLREMGLDAKRVDSAIRLSFSYNTEREEIDIFLKALEGALRLRKSL